MKGSKGKNRFNVLDGLKEKRNQSDTSSDLDAIIRSREGFEYIPPFAFADIYTEPHYDYLYKGLYVQKDWLRADWKILELSERLEFIKVEDIALGEYMHSLSWMESKTLAKELGGKLITPAEFFCIRDYLKTFSDSNFLVDKDLSNDEWFDAHRRGDVMTINLGDSPSDYTGGPKSFIIPDHVQWGYFDDELLDKKLGYPKMIWTQKDDMPYYFQDCESDEKAMVRGTHFRINIGDVPAITWIHPANRIPFINMRLAYNVTDDDFIDPYMDDKDKVMSE